MERLLDLDLGDLIGVDGIAFCSRRGELSLRVTGFALLAKSLRPPPEKHHGLNDVETRFRHRELDLIANEETRELFITRARIDLGGPPVPRRRRASSRSRRPVLQPLYGGAAARPFTTHHNALDRELYLRIATELYLKRLIVGGLERVYEIGKDFRNEGVATSTTPSSRCSSSTRPTPTTSTSPSAARSLIAYVGRATVGVRRRASTSTPPWRRETLAGCDPRPHRDRHPGRSATATRSRRAMRARGLTVPADDTWPQLVDELLSKHVEPTLIEPTFLLDYPVELSPFAKRHRAEDGLVERFEAYVGGMEIANAFTELNDPDEQRRRFEEQRALAAAGDEEAQPYDEALHRRRWSRGCRRPAGSGSGSTAW